MACGDRLRVERLVPGSSLAYMHLGIDVGDGTVVHARPDDPRRLLAGGRVVRTGLDEFAAGGWVSVTSDPPARYPPEEIVARALGQVGRQGYCPVADNCEHFANWCATGEQSSRQVEIVVDRVGRAATRAAAAVAARLAVGTGERLAIRTALGTSLRVGLRTVLPAAIVAEAAALAAEWTAHRAGCTAGESRTAGESAGLATSAASFAIAGAAAGPAGMVAGALMGAAAWAGGSAAAVAAERAVRRVSTARAWRA